MRGLFKFVKKEGQWQNLNGKTLIVDAQNVFYTIIDFISQGRSNYDEFPEIAKMVIKLLAKFNRCKITAIFVFDGLLSVNEDSWNRVRERNQNKLNEMISRGELKQSHLLTVSLLVKILKDHNVRVFQSDHSAKHTIAELSHELSCPILSGDSVFLLYNLTAGVVRLQYNKSANTNPSDVEKLLNESDTLDMLMWNHRNLTHKYNLDDNQWAIFAALVTYLTNNGNRFDYNKIIEFVRNNSRHDEDEFFSRIPIHQPPTKEEFLTMIEHYLLTNTEIEAYLDSNRTDIKTFTGKELPVEYQKLWRRKQFPIDLFNVLVTRKVNMVFLLENFELGSVFRISDPIRRVSYGIMLKYDRVEGAAAVTDDPVEYIRVRSQFQDIRLQPTFRLERYTEHVPSTSDWIDLPNMGEISNCDFEKRKTIILEVLGVNTNVASQIDSNLPSDVKFLLYVMRKWKYNRRIVSEDHVKALLICMIRYRFIENPSGFDLENHHCMIELSDVHPFSLFQAILQDTMHLNALLQQPFEEPRADKFFHGTFLLHMLKILREQQRENANFQIRKESVQTWFYGATDPDLSSELYDRYNSLLTWIRIRD